MKTKLWKRENQNGWNLVETTLFSFIFFMLIMGGLVIGLRLFGPEKSEESEQQAPAQEPPVDAAPVFTADLTTPLIILGIAAAGYVFFRFGLPLLTAKLSARRERKAAAMTNATAWASLRQRKDDLIVEWSKYETDIALMIDIPVMTDYTDPTVNKVVAAMHKLRTAEMNLGDTTAVQAQGSNYEHAVDEFELAFRTAEKHARRLGRNHLPAQDQRKLATARTALDLILSESATGSEVDAAFKTLRSSLKGIIDVPQQAMVSIEALLRKELVSA